MNVLEGARLPIYSWAEDLEEGALRQAVNCADLPVAYHHVAVMADGHQGYGVPVGAVLALDGAISPYAVGNDIGCGMAMVPTGLGREALLAPAPGSRDAAARDRIMERVQARVPAGLGVRGMRAAASESAEIGPLLADAFEALREGAL